MLLDVFESLLVRLNLSGFYIIQISSVVLLDNEAQFSFLDDFLLTSTFFRPTLVEETLTFYESVINLIILSQSQFQLDKNIISII